MAELYEGLPVVRVKDWKSVTPDFLQKELKRVERDPAVDLAKLYLPYWIARFTEGLPD